MDRKIKFRKRKKIFLFLAVFIAAAEAVGGCARQEGRENENGIEEAIDLGEEIREEKEEAPLLLKVATTKIPESDSYQGLELLKERIEADSGGTIEVQLYPSGQLGEQAAIVEGVRIGTVEMAFLPIDAAENIYPDISALSPIFCGCSEEKALQMCSSREAEEILEQMRQSRHIRCMGFSIEGVRNIWTKEEIEGMTDLEGLRLRVPEFPRYSLAFQALGASTTPMPLSQVYDGLQAELLDGVELDSESVLRYNLYEKCRYCLETRHAVTVYTFFISDEVYQGMTEAQQNVVRSAAEEVSEWMLSRYQENKETIRAELEEKGVYFYEPDGEMRQEIDSRVRQTMEEE